MSWQFPGRGNPIYYWKSDNSEVFSVVWSRIQTWLFLLKQWWHKSANLQSVHNGPHMLSKIKHAWFYIECMGLHFRTVWQRNRITTSPVTFTAEKNTTCIKVLPLLTIIISFCPLMLKSDFGRKLLLSIYSCIILKIASCKLAIFCWKTKE